MTGYIVFLISLSLLSNDPIDINSATEGQLRSIPGIGPVKASSIVEYRELFGPFLELDELEYVSGIGSGTVEMLSEHVFVDSSTEAGLSTDHWMDIADSVDCLLQVAYLDVGQGDAILLQATGGQNMLFDGGPDPGGPLEPAVVLRLREFGIDTLDILAFSHPHSDHIGGMASVLENFTVLKVMDPGMDFSSWVYEEFLEAVLDEGCSYVILEEEMVIDLSPSVTVEVISSGNTDANLNINESSAILSVDCGDFSTLLTGDMEEGSERELTPSAAPVTVLKVPHHGSLTSIFPPYLRRLSPQVAVFSAGRNNPFGHPHPRVIEIYRQMNCLILRTDTQGTIVVQTDGEAFSVSTFIPEYRSGDDN